MGLERTLGEKEEEAYEIKRDNGCRESPKGLEIIYKRQDF